MQIREQGNKIQLLRSVYDPATKKCKQILIGSMNRWRSENPSDELLSKLKDSEITALNNHLKDKADSRNTYINKVALMNAEETIRVITNSILLSEAMTENKLIAIKSGIKQLQKSLKQAEKKNEKKQISFD